MTALTTEKLTGTLGVEIRGVTREQLLHDEELPDELMHLLDVHSVLLFRQLHLDDHDQVAFCKRLGSVVAVPSHPIPEISIISLDPAKTSTAEYLKGAFHWHIDGSMDDVPCKASVMSARVITAADGGTEFASTYAAYDDLSEDEKEAFGRLRVVHTFAATQRLVYPDPTPEQRADWAGRPAKEHPLVWRHHNGRASLVIGSTADYVAGMDEAEGRALLADLLHRATRPGRVLHHDWTVGDLVIWDNRCTMHRATPFEDSRYRRELRRVTTLDIPA